MALPLLKYAPTTQNSRVAPLRVGSDEDPKAMSMDRAMDPKDLNLLIESCYRQIFFYAFKVDRNLTLESQLRNGQMSVRDFIRSLCLSDTFTRSFYNLNSNYRVVRHLVEKLLGRPTHGRSVWLPIYQNQISPLPVDSTAPIYCCLGRLMARLAMTFWS